MTRKILSRSNTVSKFYKVLTVRGWNKFFIEARYLKIPEKVSFNIASEVIYVYILRGQQFIKKNTQNGQIWRVFENLELAVKQSYQIGQF